MAVNSEGGEVKAEIGKAESRHTPGPWQKGKRKLGGDSPNGARVFGSEGSLIATLTSKADKNIDQKLADLNLIAAAPELLEACKEVLDYFENTEFCMCEGVFTTCQCIVSSVRNAISKADPAKEANA